MSGAVVADFSGKKQVFWGTQEIQEVWYGGQRLWSSFTPTLVSVTTPGPYSVPWPQGATKCDVVLCGAGGGGGGAGTQAGSTGQDGGDTSCLFLSAPGGFGGAPGTSSNSSSVSPGGSPGDKTYNGKTYTGGTGGPVTTSNGPGAPGTAPGGGGSGVNYYGVVWGYGGEAGGWAADTITTPQTLTGTVGAGGIGGDAGGTDHGGDGGDGAAYFWFYN